MSIVVVDSCVIRGDVLRQLASTGGHLTSLSITGEGFVSSRDFAEFMHSCAHIETLQVCDLLMIRPSTSNNNSCETKTESPARLAKLRRVKIECSDWIMRCFVCRELALLHVSRVPDRYVCTDAQNHIVEFMNMLRRLDKLVLEGISLTLDSGALLLCPKFKWKKLKIAHITENLNMNAITNWRQFLAASADQSRVSIESDQTDQLVSLILNECDKIDQFKFDICSLPPVESHDEEYFPKLKPVEEVRSMKVRTLTEETDARAVFFTAKFRNIEHLDLDGPSVAWFHPICIPLIFHNVKHLKVELYLEAMRNFEFPNLETLTLEFLMTMPGGESMEIFARNNSNVKNINVLNIIDIDDVPHVGLLVGYKLSTLFVNAEIIAVINPHTQQLVEMTRQEIEKKIVDCSTLASHLVNVNNNNNNNVLIGNNNNDNDNQN